MTTEANGPASTDELEKRVAALEALVHQGLCVLNDAVRANTKTLEIIVSNRPAFEPERPSLMRRIFG